MKNIDFQIIQLTIEILILLASLWLIFFKNYFKKKGENLATKEDIGEITRNVEEVKLDYSKQLESIKSKISYSNKRSEILLKEKIDVFKQLQKLINSCKIYCEARYGDYLGSDIHPNSLTINQEDNRSLLSFSIELHNLKRNNSIFLTKTARQKVKDINDILNNHSHMEIAILDQEFEKENIEGLKQGYKVIQKELNDLLEFLYQELKND